jgi:hypothetical protein
MTTRRPADFPYTPAELDALFHYANEPDVGKIRESSWIRCSFHWGEPLVKPLRG